jgi:predicted transcriptional regulator
VGSKRQTDLTVRGDLQAEIMAVIWQRGEATVEEIREQQPARRRSAYNTIQTVMNRLVDRGLLERERHGHAFLYRARIAEEEHVAHTIGERLAEASPAARRAAIVKLVGRLDPSELDEVARQANRIRRDRIRD